MAEIRELARAASAYEEIPAAPVSDGARAADAERPAAPWTHQWSPIEGGDLTPWMSAEERQQATRGALEANGLERSPRAAAPVDLTPTESDRIRLDAEHDVELGLE